MDVQQIYGITSLIQHLVSVYYSNLTSVLIVYDAGLKNDLQQQYLQALGKAFQNLPSNDGMIGVQWMNVEHIDDNEDHFGQAVLKAVDLTAVQGFITILGNTSRFLHARLYASRYSILRLKDKLYLFLCDALEQPKDFLGNEVLQFYPHHLMVVPETIYPESNNNKRNNNITTEANKPNSKQTTLSARETKNNLKVTNVTKETLFDVTATNTILKTVSLSSSFHTYIGEINNNKYRDINFELWTQQYVGAEGNLNAKYLDTYISSNGTFAKKVHLYPNKLLDQQQRTMRIGTLTYGPYIRTGHVEPGKGDVDPINSKGPPKSVQFIGAEANVIKYFCAIHNCHLRVQPYPDDFWGTIFENGSSEGMLGDLYKQHVEMVISCTYNWYNDLTEQSNFIARSAVALLGPGPSQYPRWRTVIMPFSNSLWLFLFFSMIVCSVMFHAIKLASYRFKGTHTALENTYGNAKNYEKTLLDIFAVFVQQSSADTALERVTTRVFLTFLLCATITLENIYSGQLKSILTMPLFTEPIDTMEKWSWTGWKWAAPSVVWIHTVEHSDIPMEQRLSKTFEVRDYEYMYNGTFRNDYGIGLERVYSGAFAFGKYVTRAALEDKIVTKDDLYFDWSRVLSIRGWPVMPVMDLHILYCLESGLYIHWDETYIYKFFDHQVQEILRKLATSYTPKFPPQELSIQHVSGALLILLIGYLLAFMVLIVEIFGNRGWGAICQTIIDVRVRFHAKKV